MNVTRTNTITAPTSFESPIPTPRSNTTSDAIAAMTRNVLSAVRSARDARRESSQVGSAFEKINGALLLMSDPAALETPATRALFERGQQALSEISRLGDKMNERRTKLVEQKHKEIKAAEQQIAARKSSGFWSGLLNFFKTIATACVAAVSAITGNVVGMIGAGLAFSSMAASSAGSNELALGLGIAGGMFCVAGTVAASASQALNQIAQRAKKALEVAAGVAGGAAAGCAVAKGSYDSDELEAQAKQAELKARSKRLMQQITEDEDFVRELQRIVHQSSMKMAGLLGAAHQGQLAAVAE